jgi:hypothetical protein
MVSPGSYSIFRILRSRCVHLARWLFRKIACQTIYVPGTRVARTVRQSLTSLEPCQLLLPLLNSHRALTGHRPSHFFYRLSQGTAVQSVPPSERSAGSSSASTGRSPTLKQLPDRRRKTCHAISSAGPLDEVITAASTGWSTYKRYRSHAVYLAVR